MLSCPIDFLPLEKQNGSYVCPHRHCFDIAKQGYVNLLPVQLKHSLHPGDNKEMVAARSAFLNLGLYEIIAQSVLDEIVAAFPNQKSVTLVDAGCGEGYYTAYLDKHLRDSFQNVFSLGFDISKEAVKAAAKRTATVCWAVAGTHQIPLAANSVDVLISLFGFPVYSEFYRVLRKDGLLIMVVSGENHLIELRQQIYQTVRLKKPLLLQDEKHFQLIKQNSLKQKMILPNDDSYMNLMKMTPHFYRITPEKFSQIKNSPLKRLTMDVAYAVYKTMK